MVVKRTMLQCREPTSVYYFCRFMCVGKGSPFEAVTVDVTVKEQGEA